MKVTHRPSYIFDENYIYAKENMALLCTHEKWEHVNQTLVVHELAWPGNEGTIWRKVTDSPGHWKTFSDVIFFSIWKTLRLPLLSWSEWNGAEQDVTMSLIEMFSVPSIKLLHVTCFVGLLFEATMKWDQRKEKMEHIVIGYSSTVLCSTTPDIIHTHDMNTWIALRHVSSWRFPDFIVKTFCLWSKNTCEEHWNSFSS